MDDRNLGDAAHYENLHRNLHADIFVDSDDKLADVQV
jgi:hypothetical protein